MAELMRVLLSRMLRWVNDFFFVWGDGISTSYLKKNMRKYSSHVRENFNDCVRLFFLRHFAALLYVLNKRSDKRWNVGIKTSGTSVFQCKPRLVLFITCWGAWTEQWLGHKKRELWLLRLCDAEALTAEKLSSVLLVHCLTSDLGFSLNLILM